MTIDFERQELRSLVLLPIKHLPPYEADYKATSRVGKVMAAHTMLQPWDSFMQLNLEITLSEP